jgi:signal recognition particle receptor subunit beta
MVVYNAASKELTAKIVYYGPGFGGKTTNLQFLHRRLEPSSVGNLLTLAATADRTIFFDLLPVELGDLKGYRIRFQVATVPGQSPYNETRRVVLRGADGVVFVVDSRWSQLPKNLESLQNLRQNLQEEGIDAATIPFAVQFNKRDLPDVLAVDALQEGLGLAGFPFIEAVASEGKGVVETFKLISKLTFVDILRRLQKRGTAKAARAATTETENLSAWKSSMVRTSGSPAPEIAPAPIGAFPEPIAFPEADDFGTTRAIPTLAKPQPAAATVPDAIPPPAEVPEVSGATAKPIAIAPFAIEGEERAAAEPPPAQKSRRDDEIVFEPFPPFAEPPGVTEDTNPAFFARRPPAASEPIEFSPPDERVSTAGFTVGAAFDEPEEPEALPAAEEAVPPPEAVSGETPRTAAATDTPSPSPEPAPAPVASPFEARMIQLAVVSAWGDRISAAEEKLARWEALEERLAGAEKRIADGAALPERLGAIEGRLGRAEGARGWAKDLDLLRTDWANARLASEGQAGDLRRTISDLQQSLAEGSGREMELVAQVSRQALGTAAAIEKLGFRIQETEEKFSQLVMQTSREGMEAAASLEKLGFRVQETEEKFSQLVVDQESRLGRLERLVDEQSARTTADRESGRQAVLELEERFRAFRDEETENRRKIAADLDEVRQTRDDAARRQGSADELRRRLAESLADLARRFGDDPST